jgi:polyisoprenoid-binding protein YceI
LMRPANISWLAGRFDKFEGTYTYDKDDLENGKVNVTIDVASINTNHDARDAHIREADYLNFTVNPMASFESTGIQVTGEGTGFIHGTLTLNGKSNHVHLDTKFVGEGDDPWGGYRSAFEATTTINPQDYDFKFEYGDINITLYVEGVRQ